MGLLDTVISGGAKLVDGLISGGSKDGKVTTEPWKVQAPYLGAGYDAAAGIYANQAGSPAYQGDTYAGMTAGQTGAVDGIYGYQPQGAANAANVTGASSGLLASGASGIQSATSNLAAFNPSDPTSQNINNAGQYADNPALQGAIDAASRDTVRNLSEVQLPGIARGADANGNLNSTRTGIAEGIAMRGAADRIGDIGATMRNDAYQNGLNLSEQARATNQGDYLNSQNQSGVLSDRSVAQGISGTQTGQGLAYDNFDAQAVAGGVQQQNNQGQLNADFDQWQRDDQREWEQLNQYNANIAGNVGSTQTTTAPTPGYLQTGMGLATAGLGLYGSYKNLNSQPTVTNRNGTIGPI